MRITLAVIDFVIIAMALQGLVLSALLFYSSKEINSNRWLAVFLFVISYTIIALEVFTSYLPNKYPWLIVEIPKLRMALGPLLYFYSRSLLSGDKKLSRKSYRHFWALLVEFGPQVLFILYISKLLLLPLVQKISHLGVLQYYFFGQGPLTNLPFNISFVIYSALSYKVVHNSELATEFSVYKQRDITWLKRILYAIFAIFIAGLALALLSYLLQRDFGNLSNNAMSFLVMIFAYCLGMAAYIRQFKMSDRDVAEYNKPSLKPYFSDDDIKKQYARLITLMEADQLYLNPALKIDLLAAKLAVSEKAASSLINQYIGKNFNDFVNEYRVAESKVKLADPNFSRFTIAAIAYESGFNSLATFQRCFKQFTGLTPSQYQAGLPEKPLLVQAVNLR